MSGNGDEKKVNATIHNFRNEWKYKVGAKCNASGKWQIEATAHSNELVLFVETFVQLLKDTHSHMKKEGFPPVEVKNFVPKEKKGGN